MFARLCVPVWAVIKRYGVAEIFATITAMATAWIVHALSPNLHAMAYLSSIAEALGFYAYMGRREIAFQYRLHAGHSPLKRYLLTIVKSARDMVLEFGLGEALDSLVLRPYLMARFAVMLHSASTGIFVGKIVADVAFYAIVGLCWLLKKYLFYAQTAAPAPTPVMAQADADA